MVVRRRKKQDEQPGWSSLPKRFLCGLLVLLAISRQQNISAGLNREGLSTLLHKSAGSRQTESTSEKSFDSEGYKLQKAAAELLLDQMSAKDKTIRSWGCNLKESPLVFVHIGKSGGGTIRARFAAAALNFTREKWWNFGGDNHYYPMPTRRRLHEERNDDTTYSRGTFCSSVNNVRRRLSLMKYNNEGFEQNIACSAISPLGRLVACPAVFRKDQACRGCSNLSDAGCYAVYAGHNPLGNELHWLTAPFLQDWWNDKWALLFPSQTTSSVQSITPNTTIPYWCPRLNVSRSTIATIPMKRRAAHREYYDCSKMLAADMDRAFLPSWIDIAGKFGMEKNYAPFYASMPMHRTVLMREPFSWLMSRFFWDKEFRNTYKCDDIPAATRHGNLPFAKSGWAYKVVLEALMTMCGEDCINRFEIDDIGLEEIEQQAAANLRHSFSVVGLLNETESFYEMVTT